MCLGVPIGPVYILTIPISFNFVLFNVCSYVTVCVTRGIGVSTQPRDVSTYQEMLYLKKTSSLFLLYSQPQFFLFQTVTVMRPNSNSFPHKSTHLTHQLTSPHSIPFSYITLIKSSCSLPLQDFRHPLRHPFCHHLRHTLRHVLSHPLIKDFLNLPHSPKTPHLFQFPTSRLHPMCLQLLQMYI